MTTIKRLALLECEKRCLTLSITGTPCCAQKSYASLASVKALSVPGMIGRPASMADCRADTLSPILAITEAGGPINLAK